MRSLRRWVDLISSTTVDFICVSRFHPCVSKDFIAFCRSFSIAGLREFKSIWENLGKISIPRNSDKKDTPMGCLFFVTRRMEIRIPNRDRPADGCCTQCTHWVQPLFSPHARRGKNADESPAFYPPQPVSKGSKKEILRECPRTYLIVHFDTWQGRKFTAPDHLSDSEQFSCSQART